METKKMNTIGKIALANEHLANAMRLAADLRVEMDIITDGVCVNEAGVVMMDRTEYCEACGNLDSIISLIGQLTGLLAAEAVFDDVEKRMRANSEKLTEAQRRRLNEYV